MLDLSSRVEHKIKADEPNEKPTVIIFYKPAVTLMRRRNKPIKKMMVFYSAITACTLVLYTFKTRLCCPIRGNEENLMVAFV